MSNFLKSTIGRPSYDAARLLVEHLEEAADATKYRPAGAKIDEAFDESGLDGHSVTLPAPAKGFTEELQEYVKRYSEGLTYWDRILFEMEVKDKALVVTFRELAPEEEDEGDEDRKPGLRERIQDALNPKEYKVARAAGAMLIQHGFKVREPTPAQVITKARTYSGYALLMKYPVSRKADSAGITQVYDKMVPLIADSFARSQKMRAEVQIEPEQVTLFFTKNKEYIPSIFDITPEFRVILPRRKAGSFFELGMFKRATYRACKQVASKYRKDFLMLKRPQAIWGAEGHCLIMHYRKGAGGKVVDESYVLAIRRLAEKLMKSYRIRASIQIRPETRTIILSFYNSSDSRGSGHAAVEVSGQTGSLSETTPTVRTP